MRATLRERLTSLLKMPELQGAARLFFSQLPTADRPMLFLFHPTPGESGGPHDDGYRRRGRVTATQPTEAEGRAVNWDSVAAGTSPGS